MSPFSLGPGSAFFGVASASTGCGPSSSSSVSSSSDDFGLFRWIERQVVEREYAIGALARDHHLDRAAVLQLTEEQLFRERLLDVLLDNARQRPGAELVVVALFPQSTSSPLPKARS